MEKIDTSQEIGNSEKLSDNEYIKADIRKELVRKIFTSKGLEYTINEPVTLIIRKGGSTHRVVDATGQVHCYPAPETGHSIISWIPRDKVEPVQF